MAQSIILQDAGLRNFQETFHGHFSVPQGKYFGSAMDDELRHDEYNRLQK